MGSSILLPLVLVLMPDKPSEKPLAPAPLLVGFEELQGRLAEADLRLIDARPRAEYESGHLPGAVWVDPKAVEELGAKPGIFSDMAAWREWVRPLGIGPRTTVLIYDANRQLDAARVWWLLSYLGVDQAGLVDGNFPLWQSQGRPVSKEAPAVEPSTVEIAFRNDRHASRGDVLAALEAKSAIIVDARTEAEFAGEDRRSMRGGHMPGACHVEWNNLVGRDGRFLPESELREKLAKAGVKPGEPVIAHCQGGGRASVDAFVLQRIGHPTRNYYESWGDWGNAEDTPIETGPRK